MKYVSDILYNKSFNFFLRNMLYQLGYNYSKTAPSPKKIFMYVITKHIVDYADSMINYKHSLI